MDFIVHSTICKHIHFINILYVGTVKSTDLEEPVPSQDLDEPMTSLQYLENELHSVSTKHTTAKDKALNWSFVTGMHKYWCNSGRSKTFTISPYSY